MKSLKPALTPAQIKQILTTTADPLFTTSTSELSKTLGSACNPGNRSDFRGCRLNALKAVCHPLVLDCKPGPYLQNPHTLFYVNFDQPYQASPSTTLAVASGTMLISHSLTFPELAQNPSTPDPEDCRTFDNGNTTIGHPYFSTTSGQFGLALHGDGRGLPQDQGTIRCLDTLLTQIGSTTNDFTVGLWLKSTLPPVTNGYRFFTVGGAQQGNFRSNVFNQFPPGANPGIIGFDLAAFVPSQNNLISSTTITDMNWHHVIMIVDHSNARLRLYLDGIKDGEASLNVFPSGASIQFLAGAENGSFTYGGDMDDLFVEDRAWTQEEVDSFARGQQLIAP